MSNRREVYAAIDSERDYQDKRWNADTTSTAGQHSVSEFVLFMDNYLQEAKNQLSRNAEPFASEMAIQTLRKIVGMGVACMEQHGSPHRTHASRCSMTEVINGGLSRCSSFTNPAPHSETKVDLTVKPMTSMRAKMRVGHVDQRNLPYSETLHFHAVAASKYPEDGSDENNTYAKFSPSGMLQLTVANPALIGEFTVSEEYYLDFTLASVA